MKTKISTVISLLILTVHPASADANQAKKTSPEQIHRRIAHARELLGKHYDRSPARQVESSAAKLEKYVREATERALKGKAKSSAAQISNAILNESLRYGFDPVFLMAVIQSESSFIPARRGSFGEIGLMQIKPSTGKWVAEHKQIPWHGARTLFDPVQNIRIGAAYFAILRENFDQHSRLYLAAYNMGPSNVNSALERHVWPQEYPRRVMEKYLSFYRELKRGSEIHPS